METLLIAIGAGVAFLIAYHTYGRWLGEKVFRLSADFVCPSHRLNDGKDYVPSPKAIVFGHHFTSIAGTGPIVGPAIAVMWGWLPALLWVVFGSIFIGAVHDFGALVVSLRNNGQTVGDIAGRLLNRRVRLLFLLVLFMALTIVLAIFGLVIAAVFRQYPASIFPCVVQIPIAIAIGLWLHRKGVNLLVPSILALGLMYLSVIYGDRGFLDVINQWMASWPIMTWVAVLLVYSYVASVLPVWTLLQPRDYINSLQLLTALGLIVLGLLTAAVIGGAPLQDSGARPTLEIIAPIWDFSPAEAPLIFPFLFITIACGAISGFHCLVSSGTSSKQLEREPDARFVGYGAMLTEGFLATIVILACVAGLGLGIALKDGSMAFGHDAWAARYSSWTAAGGLAQKVGAFVDGSANFLKSMGIPGDVAVALMGVLVASFAGTTLDTACRLQRYVVQELAATFRPNHSVRRCPNCQTNITNVVSGKCPGCGNEINPQHLDTPGNAGSSPLHGLNPVVWLRNKHGASLFAITVAAIIAAMPPAGGQWSWAGAGKGGMILWPMFGATNQLLGGLSFLVIGFYLWRRNKPIWFLVLPMLFMLVMPAWAMGWQLFVGSEEHPAWLAAERPNWPLIVIAFATLLLEAWMMIEAALLWPKVRGVLEPQAVEAVQAGAGKPDLGMNC
ncbi:MAG: hypothetical protein Kow00105_12990 [Phycisphaeraceae bacterium]